MERIPLERLRARFPILESRTYVNSCSQGALSTDVEAAFGEYLRSWREQGSPWERWVEELERLRELFAASIGASGDEVAVVPSASIGIDAIASCFDYRQGRDAIAMGEFEFPTMAQIWLAQRPRGARIEWARADGDTIDLAAYQAVVDERTLLVPATHVCFRNGFRLDVAALARLCRERGAYLFLDDFQRTGTGPLDVKALGVDFMVTGCLKYLLGPSGVAFLYVRRELIERLVPTITGWFGRVNPFAFQIDEIDWSASARRFEAGSPPVPNVYGAAAGLELLNRVGYPEIEGRIAVLVERMLRGASARGWRVATPPQPERRGALVVVRCSDAGELVKRLAARGIVTSARDDGLRVSFHAYNDESDVDAVLDALHKEEALLQRAAAVGGVP